MFLYMSLDFDKFHYISKYFVYFSILSYMSVFLFVYSCNAKQRAQYAAKLNKGGIWTGIAPLVGKMHVSRM